MAKKRKEASPELPPEVSRKTLPNGDRLFTVKRNGLTITCRFKPDDVRAEIDAVFAEMFKMVRTGEKPDYDFLLRGSDVVMVIEVKSKNVQRAPGVSDEELETERAAYVERAWRRFLEEFPMELYRLPAKYLADLKIAAVAELEPYSVLNTRQGVRKLYEDHTSLQEKDFKERYNSPRTGEVEATTPRQRAKLLEAYERYHSLMKAVQAKSNPRKRKPGWEEEVKKMLGKVGFEVVDRLHLRVGGNRVGGTSPGDIALELAAKECGMSFNTNTIKILTTARNEREGRKK